MTRSHIRTMATRRAAAAAVSTLLATAGLAAVPAPAHAAAMSRGDVAGQAAATVPGPPTIGTAVRGNAQATANWTAPADTGGAPLTGYRVQVRTGTTVVRRIGGIAPSAIQLIVTGLTNGTAYNFRVRAVNAFGLGPLSAASNTVVPSTEGVVTLPGPPVIRTAAAGVAGGPITATANWSPPTNTGGTPITGYVVRAIQYDDTGTAIAGITSTVQPANLRTLEMTFPERGNYRFLVRARNKAGQGPPSEMSNLVAAR
jgi:predicted phage tail protein